MSSRSVQDVLCVITLGYSSKVRLSRSHQKGMSFLSGSFFRQRDKREEWGRILISLFFTVRYTSLLFCWNYLQSFWLKIRDGTLNNISESVQWIGKNRRQKTNKVKQSIPCVLRDFFYKINVDLSVVSGISGWGLKCPLLWFCLFVRVSIHYSNFLKIVVSVEVVNFFINKFFINKFK